MMRVLRASALACTPALVACDDPIIFTAGGKLSGAVEDAPAIWMFDEDYGFTQPETRPDDPYSINLAYVQLDGHLYIYAGNTRTN